MLEHWMTNLSFISDEAFVIVQACSLFLGKILSVSLFHPIATDVEVSATKKSVIFIFEIFTCSDKSLPELSLNKKNQKKILGSVENY